jgi:hypothetical protein
MDFMNLSEAEKLIEASEHLQACLSLWMVEVAKARKNSTGGKVLRFPGLLEERAKAAQDTLESFIVAGKQQ